LKFTPLSSLTHTYEAGKNLHQVQHLAHSICVIIKPFQKPACLFSIIMPELEILNQAILLRSKNKFYCRSPIGKGIDQTNY